MNPHDLEAGNNLLSILPESPSIILVSTIEPFVLEQSRISTMSQKRKRQDDSEEPKTEPDLRCR